MVDVVRCGRRRAVSKWQRGNGGINVGRVEVFWCLENTKLRIQHFSDIEVQEDEVYVQRGEKKQRLLVFVLVGGCRVGDATATLQGERQPFSNSVLY